MKSMLSFRAAAAVVVLCAVTACSPSSTADIAGPLFAKGSGGSVPSTAPSLAGHWVESPAKRFVLPDGTAQEVWYEFDATQSGATLAGSARRYVSYWDAQGTPIVVRRDLGSPGKVAGTVGTNTASVSFLKINESKQNIGYQVTINSTATYLTVTYPVNLNTAVGFVRQ